MRWTTVRFGELWTLDDTDTGRIVRQVAKLGPYLGQAAAKYVVTGPDYLAASFASVDAAQLAAEASVDPTLTMDGFEWSPRTGDLPEPAVGEDYWCVRDSFCSLMRWPEGSRNWSVFVEGPLPEDIYRLAERLGLRELGIPPLPWSDAIVAEQAHPGIACWEFASVGRAHATYHADLQVMPRLPAQYAEFGSDLLALIIDARQPPRLLDL